MSSSPPAKKVWEQVGFGCLLLLAALIISAFFSAVLSTSKSESVTARQPTGVDGPSGNKLAPAPVPARWRRCEIQVTSQIVKPLGGQHRYFFDVRNRDKSLFDGSVTIELLGDSGVLAKETFKTTQPLAPGRGTYVHIDAHTGPVSVHGAFGIKTFKFTVKDGSAEIWSGVGAITQKFEAL